MWVTVYKDDDEAYDIWAKDIQVPRERIARIGDKPGGAKYQSDNFWQMGDTGPCGPCTEIFWDHGPGIAGGPPGTPDADGDRYIEIWNHVFMQFDMQPDGSVKNLPAPCVDTGMGLERLAAIMQHVHSNYEIDLFEQLINAASRETGEKNLMNNSLRVIADHIRACSFLVSDGVIPSNEGRGYVQRRIVRRAIRHGYKLGKKTPFFHKLVPDLVRLMGEAYPKLRADEKRIVDVLKAEEERFFETLQNGMEILDAAMPTTQVQSKDVGSASVDATVRTGQAQTTRATATVLPGEVAFKLHDTYGFPLDLTADVCRERGVTVDEAGFNVAMDKQKAQGRAAGKFKMDRALEYTGAGNMFTGYEKLEEPAKVVALYAEGVAANELKAGQSGVVVLDTTPFYAESGGQVGDEGVIEGPSPQPGPSLRSPQRGEGAGKKLPLPLGQGGGEGASSLPLPLGEGGGEGVARFIVDDTQKIKADVFGHHGTLASGALKVGDAVTAKVDMQKRHATMRNHSVTHLMHKALREVLGDHVQQKGSLVDADRTRFDFAHNQPVTDEQIREIEKRVNAEILANQQTQARVMDIESAQKTGAMMLFGEKYGETVRVLDIGSSRELCGGTHVQRTGDIGLFKVVAEGGVAAGIRRIEAVTGANALAYLQQLEATVNRVAGTLKSSPTELQGRITQVLDQVRTLEKEVAQLKGKLASSQGDELVAQAVDVKGIKVLAARLDGADAKTLRDTMDKLKDKLKTAAIVLAAVDGGKVQIAAGVTADSVTVVKAGDLANFVAQQVGGKGGGKPDMAMAGGTDPSKLSGALESVQAWVAERA
jgi:alanyl-tRNA synthetase